MGTNGKLDVQVLDAWTIVMFSKWISDQFVRCANSEYSGVPKVNTHSRMTRMEKKMKPPQQFNVLLLKGSSQVHYACLTCLLP